MCAWTLDKPVASLSTCHLDVHAPFNNLYSIHNCLLCRKPRNESPLVIKNEKVKYKNKAVNTCIVFINFVSSN